MTTPTTVAPGHPLVLDRASISFGARPLWKELSVAVEPGDFLAILGPNGSGKSTLLRSLLGLQALSSGSLSVLGASLPAHASPGRRARFRRDLAPRVGYVPQQSSLESSSWLRGRDLVRLGLDGHRFGSAGGRRARVAVGAALAQVNGEHLADRPLAELSGGEQQRLRVAQAIISGPEVLLCDEPLLSLDVAHQRSIVQVIADHRARHSAAVLFVTHEINPVLPVANKVLYLAAGRWTLGTPAEVITTERLTELYGTPVDVLNIRGRTVILDGQPAAEHTGHADRGDHTDPSPSAPTPEPPQAVDAT